MAYTQSCRGRALVWCIGDYQAEQEAYEGMKFGFGIWIWKDQPGSRNAILDIYKDMKVISTSMHYYAARLYTIFLLAEIRRDHR